MDLIVPGRSIADEIQLSLAPVFLLTAIAGLLTVLTNRLGRATDHARLVAERIRADGDVDHDLAAFAVLRRRIALLRRAIGAIVVAAFVICLVIILIFLGEYLSVPISWAIGAMFIAAMAMLIASFAFLLLEISLSTQKWNQNFWD